MRRKRNIYHELLYYPVVGAILAIILFYQLRTKGELSDITLIFATITTTIIAIVIVVVARSLYGQQNAYTDLVRRVIASTTRQQAIETQQPQYRHEYRQLVTYLKGLSLEMFDSSSSVQDVADEKVGITVIRNGWKMYRIETSVTTREYNPFTYKDDEYIRMRTYIVDLTRRDRHVTTTSNGYIRGFEIEPATYYPPEEEADYHGLPESLLYASALEIRELNELLTFSETTVD